MTQTAASWLEHCAGEMRRAGLFFGHGTDNARDEAAWLLLHVLGAPLDGSFTQWDTRLDAAQQGRLEELLARRTRERVPLAYLTGSARFCGLDFTVTPAVLVPRSPLAELIPGRLSPWLRPVPGARVLDLCTGSACIAIALARHIPGISVDAVDNSSEALRVAAQNVERHAVGGRVRLIHSDLFGQLGGCRYELIVSNPPYVPAAVHGRLPSEYRAEPAAGLVSGRDGLDAVLRILDGAPAHLQSRGALLVEVGESAPALRELLPRTPFLWLEFEHGGDGVFVLEYDQLLACRREVRVALGRRNHV